MRISSLVWGVVGLVLVSQSVAAQSLADVARREEERRKTIKAPGKVYTNEDLRRFPVPDPPPAPAPTAAPATDKPAAAAKAGDEELTVDRGEAFWRKRIGDPRDQLERNKSYLDALQSRIDALTQEFYTREDPQQRSAVWAQRSKIVDDYERLVRDNADLEKTIARVQEEARKANVPPGWVR